MTYTPIPDSLADRVLTWFEAHPNESLTAHDIGIKFCVLQRVVQSEMVALVAHQFLAYDMDGLHTELSTYSLGPVRRKSLAQSLAPKRAARRSAPVDPTAIQVCDDPLPATRARPAGAKYSALFESLRVGQCIRCKPDEVSNIANALRKWCAGKPLGPKVQKRGADGIGRVWLVEQSAGEKAANRKRFLRGVA